MSAPSPARTGPSPIVVALLGAILLALVALIAVMWIGTGEPPPPPPPRPGAALDPPEPVEDPDRVREALKEGRTYRAEVTFDLTAVAEDTDWGTTAALTHAYGGNAVVLRTVESNDGSTVVERRTFERVATAKLMTTVEDVRFELDGFGTLAAAVADKFAPGVAATVTRALPFAEMIVGPAYQQAINDSNSKMRAHVDSLSGKTVRITYVDGRGVTNLEPIDCTLSPAEENYLYTTAVLTDCHILPEDVDVGDRWEISGRELAVMLDPTWRAVPSGELAAVRLADKNAPGDETLAVVEVWGTLELDSSTKGDARVGTFSIDRDGGRMEVSQTEGHVKRGSLAGTGVLETLSKDHILFPARFRSEPRLRFEYRCELLD